MLLVVCKRFWEFLPWLLEEGDFTVDRFIMPINALASLAY
jgi:hypothetical protein